MNSKKRILITNRTTNEDYGTIRELLETTIELKAGAKDGSRWILERRAVEGRKNERLTLKAMSSGKSREKQNSHYNKIESINDAHSDRRHPRHKHSEGDSSNERSSSSTDSESVSIRKTFRSSKSVPNPFPGYTHSETESRTEVSTSSPEGVHPNGSKSRCKLMLLNI